MKRHSIKRIPLALALLPVFMLCANVSVSYAQSPRLPAAVWSKNAGSVAPTLQIGPHFGKPVAYEWRLTDITDEGVSRFAQSVLWPENVLGLLFPVYPFKTLQAGMYDMSTLAVYEGRFFDPEYQELAAVSGATVADDVYAKRALLGLALVNGLPVEVMRSFLDALYTERNSHAALRIMYARHFNPFKTNYKESVILPAVYKATLFDPYQRKNPSNPVISEITSTFETSGRVLEDRAMNPLATHMPQNTEPAYVGQAARHPAVRE